MNEWMHFAVENIVLIINAIAVVSIAFGTIEASLRAAAAILNRPKTSHELREAYLHYTRWLIVGLTFLLAADIIETTTTPTWEEIGRLAAVAAIRTFLSFFLERDMTEVREQQHETPQQ